MEDSFVFEAPFFLKKKRKFLPDTSLPKFTLQRDFFLNFVFHYVKFQLILQ